MVRCCEHSSVPGILGMAIHSELSISIDNLPVPYISLRMVHLILMPSLSKAQSISVDILPGPVAFPVSICCRDQPTSDIIICGPDVGVRYSGSTSSRDIS